jgi:hypothetical protein
VKGFINLSGYRILADPEIHVGEFAFKIVHATERTHYFSAAEQVTVRTWMKEMMKSTIGRDYSGEVPLPMGLYITTDMNCTRIVETVVSTCTVETIPLLTAQSMKPRPPSPTSRARAQRDRYNNVEGQVPTLSPEDAAVIMTGLSLSPPTSPQSEKDYQKRASTLALSRSKLTSSGSYSSFNMLPTSASANSYPLPSSSSVDRSESLSHSTRSLVSCPFLPQPSGAVLN